MQVREANVLSTASKAPARCAISAIAVMSRTCNRGIRGRFDPDELRGRSDGAGEPFRGDVVGVASDQPPLLEDALEQPVGPAVEVGRGDHLVPGPQGQEHCRAGGQPGRERQPLLSPSSAARQLLQRRAGRILAA